MKNMRSGIKSINSIVEIVQGCATTRAILNTMTVLISLILLKIDSGKSPLLF